MKQKNLGFTLVELIIVIAILAILSTGAIAGYSVYVKQANMAADKALVAEIENALVLAGYSGTFDADEGGYLILSTEGVKNYDDIRDSNLAAALTAAYGEGWQDALKLKYDGWGNNNIYISLDKDAAAAVVNSSYYKVSDQLMGQVKDITDAALEIIGGTSASGREAFDSFFTVTSGEDTYNMLDEVARQYGYQDASEISDSEFSNFLVMAVALDVAETAGAGSNAATHLIGEFALYNGYAATDPAFAQNYNDFVSAMQSANGDISRVADAFRTLRTAANNNSGYQNYSAAGGQGETDRQAFVSMLTGLTATTLGNAEMTRDNLSDANFFTDGVGNTLFTTYLDVVGSFSSLTFDDDDGDALAALDDGCIGIFFSSIGYAVAVSDSIPVN